MLFLAVLLVMWMTSHLDVLNDICHFCSHSLREARSDYRTSVSAGFSILLYSNVSSANNLAVEWTASGRSLMYARKSRGVRTLPWGMPERTGHWWTDSHLLCAVGQEVSDPYPFWLSFQK